MIKFLQAQKALMKNEPAPRKKTVPVASKKCSDAILKALIDTTLTTKQLMSKTGYSAPSIGLNTCELAKAGALIISPWPQDRRGNVFSLPKGL